MMTDETALKNPTYFGVVCSNCGSEDWGVVRAKGSLKTALFNTALTNTGAEKTADDLLVMPLKARCNACHKAFMAMPVEADASDVLDQPATLVAKRVRRFAGMMVPNYILVNGVIVAQIGNGEEVSIPLQTKHTYIQMFDNSMTGSASYERVEVQPGETISRDMKIKARWISL